MRKQTLSLLLISFIPLCAFAQSVEDSNTRSGVFYALNMNAKSVYHDLSIAPYSYGSNSLGVSSDQPGSFGLNVSLGYHLTTKLDLSLSLGYDQYTGDLSYSINDAYPQMLQLRSMPLTVQLRYYFSERPSSWYLSGEVGSQLNWSGKWASGAIAGARFGKLIPLNSKLALDAALVFDYRTVTNIPHVTNQIYSVGFSIGLIF